MEMDRRKFLTGAALAGGTVALAGLAGCSPKATEGAEAASGASTGDLTPTFEEIIAPHTASAKVTDFDFCTFDTSQPEALAPPASWDNEVDVVVAGTGGGLAGAARAAYLGNSVIAVEAANSYGGTSKSACLYYYATGTKTQLEAGLPDLTEMLIGSLLPKYPVGEKYPKHVRNCMQGIKDLVAWTEDLGLVWEPGWIDGEHKIAYCLAPAGSQEGGNSFRMMTIVEDFYDKVFRENGGEYLFKTKITGLVKEGGRIVGAQVTPEDGSPLYIKARKGVILATGGMCNNIAMLKQYCPDGFYKRMISNAGTFDNGEGIRLGLGAGAQLDASNNCGCFDGGIEGVSWNHMLYAADVQVARQPWLQIDTMGNQVVYDIKQYEATGYAISIMPESKIFSFFDANWETYCDGFVCPMCRNLTKPDMPNQDRWGGILDNNYKNGVHAAIDENRIKSGNTPEELAENMGINPEYVKNAFAKWNEMVASGDGSAYGYEPEWLHPLDTPPYYGQALGAMLYSTRSGLSITENQEVIAEDGSILPGLYAAGATSGRPAGTLLGDVGYSATSAFMAANHLNEKS